MRDTNFDDRARIAEIVNESNRLKYLLTVTYQLDLEQIQSIRVDGDNFKIDVTTPQKMLRFKAKGLEHVLMPDPDSGILMMKLDPALAQAIYNIVDEFV